MNKCLIVIASVMAAQLMVVRGQSMFETMMYANMLGQGSGGGGAGGASSMQNMAALSSLFGQRGGAATGGSSSPTAGLGGALATLGGGAGQQAAGGQGQLMRILAAQGQQGTTRSGGAGMNNVFPLATGMSLDTMMEFNMCRHMFGRSRLNPMVIMMYCNSRAA